MTTQTTEHRDEYIMRRAKEILCEGGRNWSEFSVQEKIKASAMAQKEWREKNGIEIHNLTGDSLTLLLDSSPPDQP